MKYGPVKVTLFPLEEAAARLIAERRGQSLQAFINALIRKEATIELVQWRAPEEPEAKTDATTAQPPAEVP